MRLGRSACIPDRAVFFFAITLAFLAGIPSIAQDGFTPSCPIPFDAIKKERPIDSQCDLDGEAENAPSTAQNAAKNNLCAASPTLTITMPVFDDLQQAVEEKEISFGNQHVPHPEPLPANRAVLKDLASAVNGTLVGEGTKVVFVAFVLRTKIAGQESVNCHASGKAANDIHIVLAKRPDDPECNGVTAEMIPHFRPVLWDKITFQSVMAKLSKHPVRIAGQLFFDASHSPCGHPEFLAQGDPKRRSLWEIHPVYAIDVCKNKTLAGCKVDKESVWTPFDVWVQNPQ